MPFDDLIQHPLQQFESLALAPPASSTGVPGPSMLAVPMTLFLAVIPGLMRHFQ